MRRPDCRPPVSYTHLDVYKRQVHGFVQSMKLTDYTNIRAVCIGEQTAKEAERYGMQVQISDQATIDSLVEKLLLLYGKEERA